MKQQLIKVEKEMNLNPRGGCESKQRQAIWIAIMDIDKTMIPQ